MIKYLTENENGVVRLFCVCLFVFCAWQTWFFSHKNEITVKSIADYSTQACEIQRKRTALAAGEWLKLADDTTKIAAADRGAANVLKAEKIESWPFWQTIASLHDQLAQTQRDYSQLVLAAFDTKTCGPVPTPLPEYEVKPQ